MNTTHTPGPWHVDIVIGGEHIPAIFAGRVKVASINPYLVGQDNAGDRMANARLIAAAPDLLEALQFVGEFYQRNFDVMPVAFETVIAIADAALAKAEGKA